MRKLVGVIRREEYFDTPVQSSHTAGNFLVIPCSGLSATPQKYRVYFNHSSEDKNLCLDPPKGRNGFPASLHRQNTFCFI
jgi:hypothetical protein